MADIQGERGGERKRASPLLLSPARTKTQSNNTSVSAQRAQITPKLGYSCVGWRRSIANPSVALSVSLSDSPAAACDIEPVHRSVEETALPEGSPSCPGSSEALSAVSAVLITRRATSPPLSGLAHAAQPALNTGSPGLSCRNALSQRANLSVIRSLPWTLS